MQKGRLLLQEPATGLDRSLLLKPTSTHAYPGSARFHVFKPLRKHFAKCSSTIHLSERIQDVWRHVPQEKNLLTLRRQITIIVQNDQQDLLIPVPDVPPNQTLGELKAMIEPFIGIEVKKQQLFFNNRALSDDSLSIEGVGIRDGDMVSVFQSSPNLKQKEQPPSEDGESVRLQALAHPEILERIRQGNPDLADAVNDPVRFGNIYNGLLQARDEREAEKQRALAKLNEDPFDVEAQRKIEEMIREERVEENLKQALEEMPEGKLFTMLCSAQY